MIHFCIITLGCADLVELALASIKKYAGNCVGDVGTLPADTTDPVMHGRAIDLWRARHGPVADDDIVVIMDPDVVILSGGWRREMESAFSDPRIGIWGAGSAEDFGPRVHASMMAIRGKLWNELPVTFTPGNDKNWRDTGGNYCKWATWGNWVLKPIERGLDWHEFSAWGWCYGSQTNWCKPAWVHLGGGSHSDPTRLTWLQRMRRWRAIRERERFKRLVREHLCS